VAPSRASPFRTTFRDLHANQLSGSIPTEIGLLTDLTSLVLTQNLLSGEAPSELTNLTKLKQLTLIENSLTGTIPTEWAAFTEMEKLSVDFNQMTGTLPTEIGLMTTLAMFEAVYNSLTGTLPTELGNLVGLSGLLVSRNSLIGTIPSEIGLLTNMIALYLSANQLTGLVPTELGMVEQLEPDNCELIYPAATEPLNRFDAPIPPRVQSMCVVDSTEGGFLGPLSGRGNTRLVPHDAHMTCGVCMHHRCSSWGGNKCASRKGYADPGGVDRGACMCACCGNQCSIKNAHCELHLREADERAALRAAEPTAPSPLLVLAVAVAAVGVFAAAAVIFGRARRQSIAEPSAMR